MENKLKELQAEYDMTCAHLGQLTYRLELQATALKLKLKHIEEEAVKLKTENKKEPEISKD
jgi:hypothetical protein